MSPQMEHFASLIASARAGNAAAARMVRTMCRIAVDKAPDKDLCLIASAIIGVSDQFEAALPTERN